MICEGWREKRRLNEVQNAFKRVSANGYEILICVIRSNTRDYSFILFYSTYEKT